MSLRPQHTSDTGLRALLWAIFLAFAVACVPQSRNEHPGTTATSSRHQSPDANAPRAPQTENSARRDTAATTDVRDGKQRTHTAKASACRGQHGCPQDVGPVVVIGVDGLGFPVLDPLLKAGRVPHLATLQRLGARAILKSERPMRSPALWTTIATGQPRDVHQIYDFVLGSRYWPDERRDAPQTLVTSDMRKTPALWHFATEWGLPSLVVGWLNTWPAEAIDGLMVAPYVALGDRKQTSIKGKIYHGVAKQTHPPRLFSDLRQHVVAPGAIKREQLAQVVQPSSAKGALIQQIPQLERYLYTVRWSIASALTNTQILEQVLASAAKEDGELWQHRRPPRLVMTYFDGADTLAHRFWILRQPLKDIRARLRAHDMDPSLARQLKDRFGSVVDDYIIMLDSLVGRIKAAAGPNATVMVISDHGWGSSPGVRAVHNHVPFDGEHRLDGVFLASGPAIIAGRYAALSHYEIAPTVLRLLGLSVPEALPGAVAWSCLRRDALPAAPATKLAQRRDAAARTQGLRTTPAGTPSIATPVSGVDGDSVPHAQRELERLRSLGYVQ